jgi:coenzyme F420-reducing hydrogenase alpha subunit
MIKFKEIKNTVLISAFPGTGKSHFFKNSKNLVLDSDSSKFDKKYFPNNYIDHIKNNIYKVDYILISSHKDVREALVKNKLDFILVYPRKELKDEYLERYKKRGSNENFINLLDKNWNEWIDQLENQSCKSKIVLNSNEYISDYFK